MLGRSVELYNVLGVKKGDSEGTIRKAYLKLAQRYHPDKVGVASTADEAKFKEVQHAYEVLKDPTTRAVYDKYGEEGLRLFAGLSEEDDELRAMLVEHDQVLASVLICSFFVVFSQIMVFLGLLTGKVDSDEDWSWATVFVPLWIIDAIVMCVFVLPVAKGVKANGHALITLGYALCFIVFTILLCLGLDGKITEWAVVFTPLFVVCGEQLVSFVRRAHYVYEQYKVEPKRRLLVRVVLDFLTIVARIAFMILLTLRADHVLSGSWFVVSIPIWVWFALILATVIYEARNFEGERQSVGQAVYCSVMFLGIIGTAVGLIFMKADGSSMKLGVALIPTFILFGVMSVATCCVACTACLSFAAEAQDDAHMPLQEEVHRHEGSEEDAKEEVDGDEESPLMPSPEKPSAPVSQPQPPVSQVHDID
eukprot:Sspe_Gene.86167::Locus_56874_Transcript_1_1_Confidence_1.000_Length_1388::g.86167::m.86167